jgi:glyoxylase-like metal-dependent hydrolase (beta-lactamase superfamily II)
MKEMFYRFTGIVVCIFVLVFAGSATFGETAPMQGGLTKIAENVYSYADVKNGSPANSFGANAGIIVGKDGIIVIDTLTSAKEAQRFIRDIRKVSDKPVKYVINTHYHLDHSFGNAEFERLGAIIISHEADKINLQNNGEAALKNAGAYGLTESDMEGTKLAYPVLTFTDRMYINVDGQKVELIYPVPSHTNGSIVVYLPDKKILFAGDILFAGYHPFLAEGDIESWLRALDLIMSMDADVIIPGHGPVSGKKDLIEMKDYLVIFDLKARELSAQSNDVEHITSEIKKMIPARPEGEFLIKGNIQMKYLKK